MNKEEMQEAVKWPEDLLEKSKGRGFGPPERNIDYIYGIIGDAISPDEDEFLEAHLSASVYSDYGIVACVMEMRTAVAYTKWRANVAKEAGE